jgi:hypothetical protein
VQAEEGEGEGGRGGGGWGGGVGEGQEEEEENDTAFERFSLALLNKLAVEGRIPSQIKSLWMISPGLVHQRLLGREQALSG